MGGKKGEKDLAQREAALEERKKMLADSEAYLKDVEKFLVEWGDSLAKIEEELGNAQEALAKRAEALKAGADIPKEEVPREKVRVLALERFNNHDPGDVFNVFENDAAKWIKNGLAIEGTEKNIEDWEKIRDEREGEKAEG